MAVIDTLTLNLAAQTAGLTKGLKQGEGLIKGFASSIKSPLAAVGAAFAGAFSIGAATSFVKSSVEFADNITDTAAKLQITAEAFNRLRHAAVMSDVDVESLVGSFELLNKNIGQESKAAKGMSLFLNATGKLSDTFADLQKMSPDQAFLKIADAISKIDNPFQKAQAAVAFFGRSGQDLIPLLNQGKAGIDKLGQAVANAFSDANVAAIGEADNAIKTMSEAFKSLGTEIAITIAPAIKEMSAELLKFVELVRTITPRGQIGPSSGKNHGAFGPEGPPGIGSIPGSLFRQWIELEQAMAHGVFGLGPTSSEHLQKAQQENTKMLESISNTLKSILAKTGLAEQPKVADI